MIEENHEHLMSLAEAARRYRRRTGKRLHLALLFRWVLLGRLEVVRLHGHYLTSWEAFLRALCHPAERSLIPFPQTRGGTDVRA